MEKEGQEKILKEKYIHFSKRTENIISFKQLYYFQKILETCISDEDNVMYYIMEQTEREVNVYSSIIAKRFGWSDIKIFRVIERLKEKELIVKVNNCVYVERNINEYRRYVKI